jgi:hypothetical protein
MTDASAHIEVDLLPSKARLGSGDVWFQHRALQVRAPAVNASLTPAVYDSDT